MGKVNRQDFPRKNMTTENIMCSLVRAIKNEKTGDYNDCGFENEEIFEKVLKAIEQSGIIIQNNGININITNLNNYKINYNDTVEISNRKKLVKWLKENAVQLLQTAIATIALFTQK